MRKVFTVASAMSLLLCVSVIAMRLFLSSPKDFRFYTPHHCCTLTCWPRIWRVKITGGVRDPIRGWRDPPGKHYDGRWANPTHDLPLGFRYGKSPDNDPMAVSYFAVVIPSWFLAVLFSLPPCLWLYGVLFRGAHPPDHCKRCSYNLRGNTSGVCPECGTAVARKVPGTP